MSTTEIVLAAILGIPLLLAILIIIFSRIAERRNPPIGQFVEIDGVRLHYLQAGDPTGSPLVLLHGNGAMLQDFIISGVVEWAKGRFRVICFDRPGFGHTTRPRDRVWTPEVQAKLFEQAFSRLNIKTPVIVGHSWGTLVALALALRSPKDVQGLVLVSGFYYPTWRMDVWLLSGPALPVIGDLFLYTFAPIASWLMLPKLVRKLFSPLPVPSRFQQEYPKSLMLRPSQLRAAAEESGMMVPAAVRLQFGYPTLRVPVSVMAGGRDEIVEPQQAEHLQRAVPRAVKNIIPNAGHMVHYVAGEDLIEAAALMKAWPRRIAASR
jgi:pimeloyl-ACP methyl ester carboxylesterase